MLDAAARVHGDEADAELSRAADRPSHGVGDVVELEVEEDLELGVRLADCPDDGWTLRHEQLETDLEHADPARQGLGQGQRLGLRRYVEGDDQALSGGFGGAHGPGCNR